MIYKNLIRITAILFFFIVSPVVHAQIGGLSFELPHPKKFENRKLRSEKTGDKKFTLPRRFMQNTTTHYNFFFNANEKIKEVLARAKDAHRDDYTKLLTFYNYNFEETAQYKNDLDSVIYKSTAGILLHDLRSNWVDNMYLLMGRAYFLKKDFDSAYLTFQYLNYAFSPKEKDGYDKVIGSNSTEGGTAFSIATNEKTNIAKKLLSRPPSRNESLVWQIKTFIANDELPEAAGLIQTLKYDPLFPSRLKEDLDEAQAWYFYKQQAWDSSAVYLEQALGNTANKQETARWEYLIAQLYEASGKHDLAKEFYERVIKHTIDPVMEVYAVLNSIRQAKGSDEKAIQDAVDALAKMGRRDKYVIYRDIIYYTAAQIELDRKHDSAAKVFLEKSIKYSINNPKQKSKSFLALANIDFAERDFVNAKRFYDSTDIGTIAPEDMDAFKMRKDALTIIAAQQMIIIRQDSLQKIAAMPEAERTAYIKKTLRQLRKQQGLKEEDANFGNVNPGFTGNSNNNVATDLFNNSSTAKTDWYFANASLKSKGFNDFKSKWGNRLNADNWQRSAAIKQSAAARSNPSDPNQPGLVNGQVAEAAPLTFDGLKDKLPLTPEKLKVSNDSILHARFELGKALQDHLEEYADAIEVYEKLRSQFPDSPVEERTVFNLYYCYKKTGNEQKMAEMKRLMETKFAKGKLAGIIENPVPADTGRKQEGTQVYDEVYNLFIEGKFDEALNKKHAADSLYGKHYWSPQLLYIEAVYHVHERNDSAAKVVLNNINSLYPGTPMAAKARTMIDVLGRRKQIEDYLTKLQIERPKEDSTADPVIISPAPAVSAARPPVQGQVIIKTPVRTLITDSLQKAKNKADSLLAAKKPAAPLPGSFVHAPEQAHYVVLVMDKVDPVYVGEAKNAFTRYNKEKYYNQQIDVTALPLTDDTRFLLMGKFDNSVKALDYLDKARKLAPSEIIPWMPAPKYSFIVITDNNLEILKNSKDVPAYKKFLLLNFKDSFK